MNPKSNFEAPRHATEANACLKLLDCDVVSVFLRKDEGR